jgi:hypothetical protein
MQPGQTASNQSTQTKISQGAACESCTLAETAAQDEATSPAGSPSESWLRADVREIPDQPDSSGSSGGGLPVEAPSAISTSANAVVPSLKSALPAANMLAVAVPRETPAHAMTHRFFDKENMIGFAVHGAVRIADSTQSCILLSRGGRQETWLPTKTCATITSYSLTMVATQILTSYGLHRSGYHNLERWLPYAWAAPSAAGIAVSIKAW